MPNVCKLDLAAGRPIEYIYKNYIFGRLILNFTFLEKAHKCLGHEIKRLFYPFLQTLKTLLQR